MSTPFLTDFSDRISPMLVKELRQGLRAKTFIFVFLSLQVFLAIILFSAGAASTSNSVGSTISGIIFTFFSIAVLVIQPLRGTNALSSEVKGNTIDMMVLTRLSSWRIVWGKWVAIVSQSALLFVTIIPYLILRYFFGGMNLVAELVTLFLIFLTSMALTAATVGLSGCSSVIVRAVIPFVGLLIMLWMLLVGMVVMSFGGGMGGSSPFSAVALDSSESRIGVAAYSLSIVYLGWNMLSMGASLIAPAAENHSFLRRLISLVLILLCYAAGILGIITSTEFQIALASVIAIPAIVISLTDSSKLVRPVLLPFAKRGIPGRAFGWLFYPTWSSGAFYAAVMSVLALGSIIHPWVLLRFASLPSSIGREEIVVLLGMLGGLWFPAVWQTFFFRGEGQRLAQYLLILVSSWIMMGILSILADAMKSNAFLWLFAWNPMAMISMLQNHSANKETLALVAATVDIALIGILLVRALMDAKTHKETVAEIRASLESGD